MKTIIPGILTWILVILTLSGHVYAQSNTTTVHARTIRGPQAVTNQVVANPNILVISGKILDASTGKPVKNAKINFDKFGVEMIQASIDDDGNYAMALNKEELGEPIRVIFRIKGFKKFTIKNIDKTATFVDVDIHLQPLEADTKNEAKVVYKLADDPFNTLVIKMN